MCAQRRIAIAATLCLCLCVVAAGESPDNDADAPCTLCERDSLAGGPFGIRTRLADYGLEVTLGLTQVYQHNVRGATRHTRDAGDYSGSYDVEIALDLDKLMGLPGGGIHSLTQGSWGAGVDPGNVDSLFGVNGDAAGDRSVDVTQIYYQQALLDATLIFRAGKMDLGGGFECHGCPVAFDANRFANDETLQFLNSAFVNNPSIPFPDPGLAVVGFWNPLPWWYISAAAADAQADVRETGFATAFHDESYFFFIAETGVVSLYGPQDRPRLGAYRLGVWYDPQKKAHLDGDGSKRDDAGLYVSADQDVWRENEKDEQGLGLFGRYGVADSEVNPVKAFWSAGAQYQGLLPRRDSDVLGIGVAQGRLSASGGFTARHETAVDVYYNIILTPWLSVTPDVQYILNPGGRREVGNSVVVGLRVQATF